MNNPVGVFGDVLRKAREAGKLPEVYNALREMGYSVGLTDDEMQDTDNYEHGPAVVYYP